MAAIAVVGLVLASCGSDSKKAASTSAAPAVTTAASVATTTASSTASSEAVTTEAATTEASAASTTADTGAATTDGSVAAPTGDPIKLLGIGNVNGGGPDGSTAHGEVYAGEQAAANAINAAGGVNGQPIQMDFCDTKGDPNTGRDCYRQAVDGGYVSVISEVNTLGYDVLEAGNVPSIGMQLVTGEEFKSPMSFPIVAPVSAGFAQAAAVLKADGKKKVVAAIIDVPSTGALADAVKASAEKAGIDYDAVKIPPTTTDFSAIVADIQAKGADSVLLLLNDTISVGIMQTADQLGFKPTWAEVDGVLSSQEISDLGPIAEGMVVLSATPSVFDTSNAGVVKYNKEMDAAAAAGVKNADVRANITLNSWMSVYAAVEVMKTISGPITHDSLVTALNAATDVDVQGVVPPWSPSKPLNSAPYLRATGGWLYENVVKGGKIEPSGNPPINAFGG